MKPPLRILFVVPSLERGGAETQLATLINSLPGEQCERRLAVLGDQLSLAEGLDSAVTIDSNLRRGRFDLFSTARRLAKLIDRYDIDVIHTTLNISAIFAVLARLRAKRQPPIVAAIHTTISRSQREDLILRTAFQPLLRRVERFIFVCNAQMEYWVARFPWMEARQTVIYNGVDAQRFNPEQFVERGSELRDKLGIPSGHRLVACIAAFRPEKGQDLLLQAQSKCDPHVQVAFAGDGVVRERVERLAHELALDERTHFLGLLDDVRPLLAAADAVVLASTAVETFSIAMLEAMAMETPVIAPDIGGLSEAVVPGQTGMLFKVGAVDELRAMLDSLISDHQTWREMTRKVRPLVVQKFTVDTMSRATLECLRACA